MALYLNCSRSAFERQIIEALIDTLAKAFGPEASVSEVLVPEVSGMSHRYEVDGLIAINTKDIKLLVFVEVKRKVYPRDLRNIVHKLRMFMEEHSCHQETIGLLAADVLSPGAKEELRQQNIASFDLGGSLYLRHRGLFINIEKPVIRTKKNSHGIDLFTDSRESVIHTLLMDNQEWLTVTELAEKANTSPYTSSFVLTELILREWVESIGKGPNKRRKLTQTGKLLDDWANHRHVRQENSSKWYIFVENPQNILEYLGKLIDRQKINYPWAFTGASAANIYAPLLTTTEGAEIMVPKGYATIMASSLGLKPVDKGGNITLIEREPASLLYRIILPDIPLFIASPYVLYLDLLNGRGRNKELAEHIREKLESLWVKN